MHQSSTPFGGLKPQPPHKQTHSTVHDPGCYICNDPDFARYALPLCFPCPKCGGHVAADNLVCDLCNFDTSPSP